MILPTENQTNKKNKTILGLGNPGTEFVHNRHNFGFMVVDRIAESWGLKFYSNQGTFIYADSQEASNPPLDLKDQTYFCKPTCFMNNSGIAAKQVIQFLNNEPNRLLVVYDDIDLQLGKIRLRKKGSAGGHKGIESIIKHIETTEFPRLRLGIGPQDKDIPSEIFVLSNFRKDELPILDNVIDMSVAAIIDFINKDIKSFTNRSISLSQSLN